MIYTYDATFFGFLSAVFDGWHQGLQQIEDIHAAAGAASLFGEEQIVHTNEGKARRILDRLQEVCGSKAGHFLYYAFLAEQPQREMKLLQYLRRAFQLKLEFLHHLQEPAIWEIRQWARKSGNERHKLLGLVRFRELPDGMLYCAIAPTCCVVPVMAPHFVKRLSCEQWVIHDTKRHMGVYYDRHALTVVDIPKTVYDICTSAEEKEFAALWRQYYQTIAITQRRNEILRRSFMPKKYWSYLIEMKNGGDKL